ncbi:MAG: hypothetical protein SOY94_01175 [Candidatus Limiplasma sp.]|nr:hypothetical protein [Candidatus Limiplasma sp.]
MSKAEKKTSRVENLVKIINLVKVADDRKIELETLTASAMQTGYELGLLAAKSA